MDRHQRLVEHRTGPECFSVAECAVVEHQLLGECSQFDVRVLGSHAEHVEGRHVIDSVEQDEHAYGLVDHCPVRCNFCDCSGYLVADGGLQWGVQTEVLGDLLVEAARCVQPEFEAAVRRMFVGITSRLVPVCSEARIRARHLATFGRVAAAVERALAV
jgi:hypothetical protein